jgi:hypothetical protein
VRKVQLVLLAPLARKAFKVYLEQTELLVQLVPPVLQVHKVLPDQLV